MKDIDKISIFKNIIIITLIFIIIAMCCIFEFIYNRKLTSINNNNQIITDNIEANNTNNEVEKKEYDCSFTKTFKIIKNIDYKTPIDGSNFAAVEYFQDYWPFIIVVPSDVVLEEYAYYEFTYTLKGKGAIEDLDDVNNYLVGSLLAKSRGNEEAGTIYVDLTINKTDKKGDSQINDTIKDKCVGY